MADIMKAIEWLENLKINQRVLIRGNTYPFYYLHVDSDKKKKVGKCTSPGQVRWAPVDFSLDEIKSNEWVLQIEQ